MNKQEKYINYIVDDLVSDTEIDYTNKRFTTPFSGSVYGNGLPPFNNIGFVKYVRSRYGANDMEFQHIWILYGQKIKTLLRNG